jgi:cytoskeletal protein RodZ
MRLKQEREKKSVTLDDISLSTKISTRMLRALEEEHFDQLPGGIFNKGFIRAYARCLGMDEEQAIADYLAATGGGPLAKPSEINEQAPILEPPPREQTAAGLPWGMLAVVLLIVALGFAAWGYYSRESQKGTQESDASATPSSNQTSSPVAESSPSPASPGSGASPAEVANSNQSSAKAPTGNQTPQPTAASPPVSTPDQSPPPRTGGFTVLIKARQDSWLAISIDGEVSTQTVLPASAQKTVRATREIVVRAGNVGGLDFEFNGKKLPPQGDVSEVRTLTFNAHGVQAPTPRAEPPAQ